MNIQIADCFTPAERQSMSPFRIHDFHLINKMLHSIRGMACDHTWACLWRGYAYDQYITSKATYYACSSPPIGITLSLASQSSLSNAKSKTRTCVCVWVCVWDHRKEKQSFCSKKLNQWTLFSVVALSCPKSAHPSDCARLRSSSAKPLYPKN